MKPRLVPAVPVKKVEEELDRLKNLGVISPILDSDFATSLVPILKSDEGIRLRGDYEVTLNKIVEDVKFPLPRIEDIFSVLHGCESFSKIDCNDVYIHLEVDDETAKLLAWNTHKGLYRVN